MISILAIGLAAGLRILLRYFSLWDAPIVTFTLTVLAIAAYRGLGPGLLATLLGAFVWSRFFSTSVRINFLLLFLAGAGVSLFCSLLVSERRKAVRAETEARQQNKLIDLAYDAILVLDLNSVICKWNAGATATYGWTEAEAIGKVAHDLFRTQFATSLEDVAETLRRDGFWEGELRHTSRDGTAIIVESRQRMLRDEAGAPLWILEIHRDITGRKRSEEALRRSESRFRSLSQANVIGVACGEPAGSVVEANDAFLQMTGYGRDDLRAGKIAWVDLAGDSRTPFEKEFLRKDGSRLPVLLFAGTPESPGDECVTIIVDLSERKMLENKLRQKQKLETIGLLAAGVAHDFNNLLTGILMNTQLSLDNLSASDPGRGMLEEVIRESERAARLTSQLVAYTGKGRVSARWIDVTAVVQITVAQMRNSIPRQIRVRCEFDPHLSAIEADKDQIQQLMSYLIVNAVEAIGENPGGEIAVSATRSNMGEADEAWVSGFPEIRSGEYVLIRVQDNGSGMDEATLARAFDPFFSTKFLGRGLGLAAAQGIARAHRGAIRIVSAPGQGATVEVLFPTSAAASQSA